MEASMLQNVPLNSDHNHKPLTNYFDIVDSASLYARVKSFPVVIMIKRRNHTQSLSDNISKQNKLLTSTTADSKSPSLYECLDTKCGLFSVVFA